MYIIEEAGKIGGLTIYLKPSLLCLDFQNPEEMKCDKVFRPHFFFFFFFLRGWGVVSSCHYWQWI